MAGPKLLPSNLMPAALSCSLSWRDFLWRCPGLMCGKWVQMAWASSSCLAVKVRSASFNLMGRTSPSSWSSTSSTSAGAQEMRENSLVSLMVWASRSMWYTRSTSSFLAEEPRWPDLPLSLPAWSVRSRAMPLALRARPVVLANSR